MAVILAGLFGVILLGKLVGALSNSGDEPDPEKLLRTDPVAARVLGSTATITYLRKGAVADVAGLLATERSIHEKGIGLGQDSLVILAHNVTHNAAAEIRLDSAAHWLKRTAQRGPAPTPARNHLAAAFDPLSPSQTRRKQALAAQADRESRRIEAEAAVVARRLLADNRRQYAQRLESEYLDQGLDITVTTKGAAATTLRLKWILVSRVTAHQLSKSGPLWANLRSMGFKRLEITDGYDDSWSWTID
ncbi:MAG TPA: hypothetical protein VMY38_07655 [Gemmatimonadaceae bacterium]|nr:hypothetical protein [Gemmatimonadaceae bacterium]